MLKKNERILKHTKNEADRNLQNKGLSTKILSWNMEPHQEPNISLGSFSTHLNTLFLSSKYPTIKYTTQQTIKIGLSLTKTNGGGTP